MEMSTSIAKLADAMAKAQAQIEGAIKDSNNPHFNTKYADLSSVWDAWQKVGPANGLSVMQFPGACVDNRMAMTTLVAHSSGEWVRDTLTIPLQKVDAQGYGSATTYARRYALAAAVGIAPEDDDGNAAAKAAPKATPAKPANNDGEGQPFPPGPCRNISNLKSMARDIWRQIEGCGDQDQLDAYLADKDVKAVLKQAAELTGAWGTIYYGDGGDNPGLQGLIAKKSRELSLNDFIPERNPIAAG